MLRKDGKFLPSQPEEALRGRTNEDVQVAGATPKAAGVYGETGSLSPVIGISQIIGNFAYGQIPANQQGPNDDPDNDDIANLMEYMFTPGTPVKNFLRLRVVSN